MIGTIRSRLSTAFRAPAYRPVELSLEEPIRMRPSDGPGVLLRIRPHVNNDGMPAGATLLRSLYDLSTTSWGRNVSDHYTFELWCDDGTITFYLHAVDEHAGATFRRRLANTYGDSEVIPVSDDDRSPVVRPDSMVAGAKIAMRRHPYFPIRHHDGDGFASDPYSQLTSELLSTDETTGVIQVSFRPAKRSWMRSDLFRSNGIEDVAHGIRQGTSVGWINPRRRPPSEADERIATRLERQVGRLAFQVNARVLVVSDDPGEASARLRGIADAFRTQYDSAAGQGLAAQPITHRCDRLQARRLRRVLDQMVRREWVGQEMVLTVHELAGLVHLPNEEIGTPAIDWRRTARGDAIPADAPQFDDERQRPAATGVAVEPGGGDRRV